MQLTRNQFRSRSDFGGEQVARRAEWKTVRSGEATCGREYQQYPAQRFERSVDFDAKASREQRRRKKIRTAFLSRRLLSAMIYTDMAIYGQQILAARKKKRASPDSFRQRPFGLMMEAKLTGVGLAGLTQLATIWIISSRWSASACWRYERSGE